MARARKRLAVPKNAPAVDLPAIMAHARRQAAALDKQRVDMELVCARLADGYRAAGLLPWPQSAFFDAVADLETDTDTDERLALAVSLLDLDTVRTALAELNLTGKHIAASMRAGFVDFARLHPLLTLNLLHQAPPRVEEFSRSFAMQMGFRIADESIADSLARLAQLDYGKLLADAEAARQAAQARMEYLKKKQEEEMARRRPRGKH